jgi:hypothetical protein
VNHLDRNLDVLVQELTIRCHRLFVRASGAATRSAVARYCPGSVASQAEGTRPLGSQTNRDLVVRERIMKDKNEVSCPDVSQTWPGQIPSRQEGTPDIWQHTRRPWIGACVSGLVDREHDLFLKSGSMPGPYIVRSWDVGPNWRGGPRVLSRGRNGGWPQRGRKVRSCRCRLF